MLEGIGGGMLNGEELARVGIVLHVGIGADEEGMADDEAASPARHVEGLAGGV